MITKNQFLHKLIPFTIVGVAIYSVLEYPKFGINFIGLIKNVLFWWIVQIYILYLFWLGRRRLLINDQKKLMVWVQIYLLWNVFSIARGIFIAETYWDWKSLITNTMSLLLPIAAYAATDAVILQSMLKTYIKYALPLFIVFVFSITTDAYGFYLVPVSFLLLFVTIIKKPWQWIVLALGIFVVITDLTARSNAIKFAIPIAFSMLYYFRNILSTVIFELIRKCLFVAPIVLFILALYVDFNVFKMDEYIKGEYVESRVDKKGQKDEEDLLADSRTFMFVEAFHTATVYDSWWMGRSPARGNISEMFGEDDMNKRGERIWNEMALANVFNWTGIIGVFLYFMAFYKASYIAINQSNNTFSKILGLYIGFHWLYSWVENINIFSLTTFFLWITIGFCFSTSFRKMTDQEVKIWVQGIFGNKKTMSKKLQANLMFKRKS